MTSLPVDEISLSIQPLLREPLLDEAGDLEIVPVHHQHVGGLLGRLF
jgi:hypothetical protein